MQRVTYGHIFKELLKTDLIIMRTTLFDRVVDLIIWISAMLIVNAYLMPAFGLSLAYGPLMLASLCASAGLFEVFSAAVNFVNDLEGDQILYYYITLPIPAWLVLIRAMVYHAIKAAFLGIFVLPIGALILWNRFDPSNINIVQYLIIFVLTNLFYGTFSLFAASFIKNMLKIGSVWMRLIYPIWFFGCFQFSWQALYEISPTLAYLNLLNPITYVMEGFRAALLGQPGSLNFWVCAGMLIIGIVLSAIISIIRLKRRLDFI